MKKTTSIFILLISILFSSCTKEVDIKNLNLEQRICVYSLFTADKYLVVNVSKTSANINETKTFPITDAKVILWSENQKIEELSRDSLGYYSTKTYKPVVNKEYTITIDVDGFKQVKASDKIPQQIAITKHDVNFYNIIFEYYYFSTLRFQFQDPVQDSNYYLLSIKNIAIYPYKPDTSYWSDACRSEDPIIFNDENHNNNLGFGSEFYLIFNDSQINGQSTTLNINYWTDSSLSFITLDTTTINSTKILIFKNISKNMYLFFKSLNLIDEIDGYDAMIDYNIFSRNNYYYNQYTNIENGIGIFAGFSSYQDTFLLNNEKFNCVAF